MTKAEGLIWEEVPTWWTSEQREQQEPAWGTSGWYVHTGVAGWAPLSWVWLGQVQGVDFS